jgi:DNA-binding response OmpR family regulator
LVASTRILAVEDEADIAEFLRAYFRASGYDLVHLDPDDADEVVSVIDEYKPDLVLLDFRLRGFDGDEAYRAIRTCDRFSFLPVIVVTGDANARDKTAGTAIGIDGFVAKPFNVNSLAELVGAHIESARALAESGRDLTLGVMTQGYLSARLHDEVHNHEPPQPVSFGLVQLRNRSAIEAAVGADGLTFVIRELIAIVRESLPAGAVLGRTDSNELAVVLPGTAAADIEPVLATGLRHVPESITLPGGGSVEIRMAAGLASFPAHAASVDELYMAADAALADAVDRQSALSVAI